MEQIIEKALCYVEEYFKDYRIDDTYYKINCIDGDEYKITKIVSDSEMLDLISEGDKLKLSIHKNEIVELNVNGKDILVLEVYQDTYHRQFIITIIIVFIFIIAFIGGKYVVNKFDKAINQKIENEKHFDDYVDEEVYKRIQNSITKKNGIYRCNILEEISDDRLVTTFCRAIIDYINEGELVFMIDECGTEDSLALVFFKMNDKLYFEQLFKEEDGMFELSTELYWYYPGGNITDDEASKFLRAVKEFKLFNKDLVK